MAAASLQAQPPSWLGPQSAPAARRACRVFPHSQPAHRSRSSVGPARAAAALATAITVSRRQNGRGRSVAFAEGPMAGVGAPPAAERPALPNTPGSKRLQVPDFSSCAATLDQAGTLQSLSLDDASFLAQTSHEPDCNDIAPGCPSKVRMM